MLSVHFICIGSDLLNVMNGLLQFWEEPYASSMARQFNSSCLKCLNIHLFRLYNTNTYTYIWNDFEIAEANIIIAHCLGHGSILKLSE